MALTYTNSSLTSPANKTQIEQNFTDVQTKFNAGITTADLSSSAGITNAQLANSIYEFVVSMDVTSAMWTAAEDDDIVAVVGLPEDTNGTSYTILAADYLFRGHITAHTSGAEFNVEWGYFSAGAWTMTSEIVSTVNFTGAASVSSNLTLNTSTVTTSTTNRHFFAVTSTDVIDGTRPMADAEEFLTVSLKLKRTSGLRS